jgi:murein DD-endopeptidase MepM/ murein hydrolase activator NlpD
MSRTGRSTAPSSGERVPLSFGILVGVTALLVSASGPVMAQTVPPEPTPEPTVEPTPEPPPEPAPPPSSAPPAPEPQPQDPPTGTVQSSGGPSGGGDRERTAVGREGPGQRSADDAKRKDRKRRLQGDACAKLEGVLSVGGAPASTDRLADTLASTERFGLTRQEAFLRIAGPFPVAAQATWTNDWHARRCEPTPHLHEGIDIFAADGAPVVATAEGRITQRGSGAISGMGLEITDESGIQYFYAHLSGFATGLSLGQTVQTGQVLGFVGTTGNARGTSPHLHLEIQPDGVPVPPKPFVDRWLEITERRAKRLVQGLRTTSDPVPRSEPPLNRDATDMAGSASSVATQSAAPSTAIGETSSHPLPDLGIPPAVAGASAGGVVGLALVLSSRRRRPRAVAVLAPAPQFLAMAWGAQPLVLLPRV